MRTGVRGGAEKAAAGGGAGSGACAATAFAAAAGRTAATSPAATVARRNSRRVASSGAEGRLRSLMAAMILPRRERSARGAKRFFCRVAADPLRRHTLNDVSREAQRAAFGL